MSTAAYSEINLHITWHTKNSLPMIGERVQKPLYQFLTHKILETTGVLLHGLGGIEDHMHIAVSVPPDLLISDWIGKLKGSSSHYINREIAPKALEWQRGYGVVSFGTKDLPWSSNIFATNANITNAARLQNGWSGPRLRKDVKTPFRGLVPSLPRPKGRGYLPCGAG